MLNFLESASEDSAFFFVLFHCTLFFYVSISSLVFVESYVFLIIVFYIFSNGIVEPGKKFEMIFNYTPLVSPPIVGSVPDSEHVVDQSSFIGNSLEESLWRFQVNDYVSRLPDGTISESSDKPILVPLLLVGRVSEPRVFLEKSSIRFRSMLIGGDVRESVNLVNSEHIPFSFSVELPSELLLEASASRKSTLPTIESATGQLQPKPSSTAMLIEPMQGVVGPNSSFPISIIFHPLQEKEYSFNVAIAVRGKSSRISFNLKGEGYSARSKLTLLDDEDASFRQDLLVATPIVVPPPVASRASRAALLAAANEKSKVPAQDFVSNPVNFGDVHIFTSRSKKLVIANSGKFSFDYSLRLPQNQYFTLSATSGTVKGHGGTAELLISFMSDKSFVLDKPLKCVCTISVGDSVMQKYILLLSGKGFKPQIDFSFLQHNFGPVFVIDRLDSSSSDSQSSQNSLEAVKPCIQKLRITNREPQQSVTLDFNYESKSYLGIQLNPSDSDVELTASSLLISLPPPSTHILEPGSAVDLALIFAPNSIEKFSETIPILINSLYRVPITVTGEGIPLRIGLSEASDANQYLGDLRVGQVSKRTIQMVNRSRTPVAFSLLLSNEDGTVPNIGDNISFADGNTRRTVVRASAQKKPRSLPDEDNRPSFDADISFSPRYGVEELVVLQPRDTYQVIELS